ncbi:hypothetical protein ACF064_35110 [Streptomyces sp. NPDC015492]|uniref:hypothetical protein n=1 Tax=Streptomyces sp. NPDC015492 TaxID=3364958 RepID=UPI0036F91833
MRVAARDIVYPWQIGLAACAVVTPLVLATAFGDPFILFPFVIATAALTAVPLLLYARPSAFQWAAGIISAVLLPWSLVGSWVGMLVFYPSAPLLLLAALSDPRRRPKTPGLVIGAGLVLAAAVAPFSWASGY